MRRGKRQRLRARIAATLCNALGRSSLISAAVHGAEVDLILERDGRLHPVEIKARTTLRPRDLSGLRAFRETYPHLPIGLALVVFAGRQAHMLDDETLALPWSLRWDSP